MGVDINFGVTKPWFVAQGHLQRRDSFTLSRQIW